MSPFKKTSLYVFVLLALFYAGAVFYGSESLASVTFQFVGKGREHQDKYILGINSAEKAPDYILEVRVEDKWEVIGSKNNTFSGPKAITFSPQKRYPVRLIEEIRLMDMDTVENDFLLTAMFEKGTFQVGDYEFDITTRPSLMGGMSYFWHTSIGKALLAGITLCVIILILSAGIL